MSTYYYVIGSAVSAFFGFCTLIVLSRFLPPEQFGNYQVLIFVASLLTMFSGLGLTNSLSLFVPRSSATERSIYVSNAILVLLVLTSALSLVAYAAFLLLSSNLEFESLVLLAFPATLAVNQTIPLALLSAMLTREAAIFAAFSSIVVASTVALTAVTSAELQNVYLAATLSQAAVSFLGLYYLRDQHLLTVPSKLNLSVLKLQIRRSVPLWGSSALGQLSRQFDLAMLAVLVSSVTFANYSLGARELPLVGILAYGLTQSLAPRMSQLGAASDLNGLTKIWQGSLVVVALVIFPVSVFTIFFSNAIVIALFGEQFKSAGIVLSIYTCLLPLRLSAYGTVLTILNHPEKVFTGMCIALGTNVLISSSLYAVIGWYGPAYGTLASQAIMIFYYISQIKKITKSTYNQLIPSLELATILLASIVALVTTSSLGIGLENFILNLAFDFTVFACVYLLSLALLLRARRISINSLIDFLSREKAD